ncbi:MAG: hypothetical protein JRF53_00565 [Deltaproteobacteria bacterium]|nr:hypothetical protein [Deltaproteobacteria bacterium]
MFDVKKFMSAQFVAREEDVPVPDMKDFFGEDKKPVWRVRGLNGQELGVANASAERNRNIEAVLEGIVSAVSAKKAEAVRKLVGAREDVPDDIAKRLEMLVLGSVEPAADIELAIKICRVYPIEFYSITNTINRLTGMGFDTKKKSTSSGKT